MNSRVIYFSLFNPDLNSDNRSQNVVCIVKGITLKMYAVIVKDTVKTNI